LLYGALRILVLCKKTKKKLFFVKTAQPIKSWSWVNTDVEKLGYLIKTRIRGKGDKFRKICKNHGKKF